jgi:hypothetical protein
MGINPAFAEAGIFALWLWHCYHETRGFSGLGERAGEVLN